MPFTIYALVIISVFALTAILEYFLIPLLKNRAKQPIYADGPSWHLSKSGTPTMGGLAFLISSIIILLPIAIIAITRESTNSFGTSVLISLIYATTNALIGIIDDVTKLKRKENAGLTPIQKIFFQLIFAIIFLMSRAYFLEDTSSLHFSFGSIDIGIFYYPLSIIMLLGIVNCANLTDGVDGLASSVAFAIGIILLLITHTTATDTPLIASAIIGASLGFLVFNIHPAKIFMGDTGSLFLGALIVSCSFSFRNPMLMIFIGGVYVIEGVSVILQVIYYKLTGKRLFKMAPLHHHLEKCGMSECKICMIAVIATLLLAVPLLII